MLVSISTIVCLLANVRSVGTSTAQDDGDCSVPWDVDSDLEDMPEVSLLQTHMTLGDRGKLDTTHANQAMKLADEKREKPESGAVAQTSSQASHRETTPVYTGFDGNLFVQDCHWVVLALVCILGLVLAVTRSEPEKTSTKKSGGFLKWARRDKMQDAFVSDYLESAVKAGDQSEEESEHSLSATQPEEELEHANALEAQPEEEPEAHDSEEERIEYLFDKAMEVLADGIVTSVALAENEDDTDPCNAATIHQCGIAAALSESVCSNVPAVSPAF
jgi:hypothetical protein